MLGEANARRDSPSLVRIQPIPGEVDPFCPSSATQALCENVHFRLEFDPYLVALADYGSTSTMYRRKWPMLARVWPNVGETGQVWLQFGHLSAHF